MDPEKAPLIIEYAPLAEDSHDLHRQQRRQRWQRKKRVARILLFVGTALNVALLCAHMAFHARPRLPPFHAPFIDDLSSAPFPSSGDFTSPDGRKTVVESPSNAISGTYSLYDLLSIRTRSGSITVSVKPQEADSSAPDEPAVFAAHSMSGSIDIDTDFVGGVPSRPYRTSVTSGSGSVSGSYILGRDTVIRSGSGSLDGITLLPVLPSKHDTDAAKSGARLVTSTRSGSQSLRVLSPAAALDSESFETTTRPHFQAHHDSYSGGLDIEYPSEWEGELVLTSSSGSLNVVGEGIEIIKEHHGVLGKTLIAKKGNAAASKVVCTTHSGHIYVQIG